MTRLPRPLATGMAGLALVATLAGCGKPSAAAATPDHTHSAQLEISGRGGVTALTLTGYVFITGTPGDLCTVTVNGPAVWQPWQQQAGITRPGGIDPAGTVKVHVSTAVAVRGGQRAIVTTNCGAADYVTTWDFNI